MKRVMLTMPPEPLEAVDQAARRLGRKHSQVVRVGSPHAQGTGLDRGIPVQAEVIQTVPKARVVGRLGCFNEAAQRVIDQALKASLGLDGA